jgi:hypothetical protein
MLGDLAAGAGGEELIRFPLAARGWPMGTPHSPYSRVPTPKPLTSEPKCLLKFGS